MLIDPDPRRRLEREAAWFHAGVRDAAQRLGVEVERVITEPVDGGVTLSQILAALGGGQ
jgi:hypothetical protein